MKDQFDWFVGEEDEEDVVPLRYSSSRWAVRSVWFLIVATVITGALLGSWQAGQNQLELTEKEARTAVQALLDLEHNAFLAGDGDLYFSFYGNDSDWIPAQLLPVNMGAARAGFQVTRAEPHEEFIRANLSWTDGQQTYQRIAFFQWQNEALIHTATAPDYWGSWISVQQAWGDLIYTEIDETWANEVSDFVARAVAEICWRTCLDGRLPFTLHLATDYSNTAVPGQLRIPSPRLLALTEEGQPAPIFWEMLHERLESHLTPTTIRFALPPDQYPLLAYEKAATDFMAHNPNIVIELVQLNSQPDDLAVVAQEFDGAAIAPSADLIAAGMVHDLTDFADTDPNFDQADFYEQIWQGAQWRGRMWFMPQAAGFPVLFYDKAAYVHAGRPEPSLRWTWDEMAQDIATLVASQPEDSDLLWAFLDINNDALLSFAYNWNNTCDQTSFVLCPQTLPPANIAAALNWYSQLVAPSGLMPDLTGFSLAERESALLNLQASRRQVAVWVDRPVVYEHYLLLDQIGVVPFPGSNRFDGITPLRVRGNFISQESKRPFAVWQWLKFLSYYPPSGGFRLVPARPSVADQAHYWTTLPRSLGDAMRTAFPFSRPVILEEYAYFPPEQLAAVSTGTLTPQEAAQQMPRLKWFQ